MGNVARWVVFDRTLFDFSGKGGSCLKSEHARDEVLREAANGAIVICQRPHCTYVWLRRCDSRFLPTGPGDRDGLRCSDHFERPGSKMSDSRIDAAAPPQTSAAPPGPMDPQPRVARPLYWTLRRPQSISYRPMRPIRLRRSAWERDRRDVDTDSRHPPRPWRPPHPNETMPL